MAATLPLPCKHASPVPGCAVCRIAHSDARYRALFGVAEAPAAPPAPCGHLGTHNGFTVECAGCRRGTHLKLFHCAKHGQCTVGKAAPGVACCVGCPDHTARQARPPAQALPAEHRFAVRDCLYHVYPLPGEAGAIWRQRLGMVLSRASLFTGRKIIACMTGPHLEKPQAVRELAEPRGFEVAEIVNTPGLREAKTFIELLPRFETDDPQRALFFGHAKGVTRPVNKGTTCHPWSVMCHEICLDYWPLVETQLGRHPITGPFKKVGRGFAGSLSAWHYSGSFFWARSKDLFSRAWRSVDTKWFGAESTPGTWFTPAEAGCLFHEGTQGTLDLYRMDYLRDVLVEYLWWRGEMAAFRTQEVPA